MKGKSGVYILYNGVLLVGTLIIAFPGLATRVGRESAGEHVECLFKVMTTEDVGYTHLLAAGIRGCIESCCGGKHDGLPLVAKICKTPGAKAFGIVNGKMGYSIECSHRLRRVNAGDAVEPTHETISPRLIFLARCGQIGCIGLHGGFGCYLPKKRRRKTSLA